MTIPALFQPLTLRSTTIPNRIWLSPLCEYSAGFDGIPTDWHMVHLGQVAIGRAGLVMAEATAIEPAGRISPHDVGIWNDAQRDAWKPITAFIRSQGSVPAIQLAHAGRKGSSAPGWGVDYEGTANPEQGGWQTVAPSAVAFTGYDAPIELTTTEIDTLVAQWAAAARRALDAGFEVIEVHAAHGYLLHEFLSPLTNFRTDNYGGSLDNRARIVLEVIRSVRAETGPEVPIFMRFSATDWTDEGLQPAEVEQVAVWAHEAGADFMDISTGGIQGGIHIPTGPGYQVRFAESVRRASNVPTNAVGQITTPEQANEIVASGAVDAVMLGRELMRDPHFALRAATTLGYDMPYWPPQYLRAKP
jgi:2,4-dienoyl-CoA reductase-like NADH-dependent reductase (Old Yellow Enzyme family)